MVSGTECSFSDDALRIGKVPAVIPLVAILCGGKGTRMRHAEVSVPKPLVEIGGRPILWHVMSIYAAQGFNRFVLLPATAAMRSGASPESLDPAWSVTCADTGEETPTGGRVAVSPMTCAPAPSA